MKMKDGLHWTPRDVRDAIAVGELPRRAANTVWHQPDREREVLRSTKLERVCNLKSSLTSDVELKDLEFPLLGFDLALVQYFFTLLLPPSQNGNVYSVPLYVRNM